MKSRVGPLTAEFFKKCGYDDARIRSWSGETRLLQDLGLTGDDAWDEFTAMDRDFGVDLTGFSVDRYFPPELSRENLIVRLFGWTRAARRVRDRYPEITLDMVEATLLSKKWTHDTAER